MLLPIQSRRKMDRVIAKAVGVNQQTCRHLRTLAGTVKTTQGMDIYASPVSDFVGVVADKLGLPRERVFDQTVTLLSYPL